MNDMLLLIFDEMLNGLADRMKSLQEVIEKRKAAMQEAQQGIRGAEDRLKCAVYEDARALQKIDVLSGYLAHLGKHPQVLMTKVRDLREAQVHTKETRRMAEERVTLTKGDLQSKQTLVAVAEQEYGEVQKQWNEVSEMASQERANGSA